MNTCFLKRLISGAVLGCFLSGAMAFAAPKKIVLIAGPLDNHPPGTHEYENNILLLKHCIESAADFGGAKAEVYFNGWPEKPSALDDADTIFLTSGGSDRKETDHPLYVGDHFSQLEKQMKRGCGLVLYHWSTFHPSRAHDQITEWVGGYFDYEKGSGSAAKNWFSKIENHNWIATPAGTTHPAGFGLKPFELAEEFYFNIRFRDNDPRLMPILLKDSVGDPKENVVAWAVEREGGGRGLGFTGGHFYTNWWIPDFRKLVLNAIAWTAKIEVPRNGIDSSLENFKSPVSQKTKSAIAPTAVSSPGNSSPNAAKKLRPATMKTDGVKAANEEDWKDNRLNQTDVGQFFSSLLPTPTGVVRKGISIKIGDQDEAAVCYDTASASLRAAWTGKWLQFDPARFGLINSPRMAGELQFALSDESGWRMKPQYRGLYLKGKRVVLSYEIDGASVLESPWLESAEGTSAFTRTFQIDYRDSIRLKVLEMKGARTEQKMIDDHQISILEKDGKLFAASVVGDSGAKLNFADNGHLVLEFPSAGKTRSCKLFVWSGVNADLPKFARLLQKNSSPENLQALTQPGEPRWKDTLGTKGTLSPSSTEPYVVDTITVPYENPYKALMFLSGVDFFPNGDAAVCSIHGDVWRVSGIDDRLDHIKWKRFASGLFQPLGLKIVDGNVHVLGRDQITVLHDRNHDGEADFYENFFNEITTSEGGHDYVTCLETDAQGNFYYVDPDGVHRVSKDGKKHETIATGWRNPNGMSVSPEGVITVAPQQGTWTPSSAICEVKPSGYYGFGGPHITPERQLGYDAPLCWIPHVMDNSTGSQLWVTSDQWGPLKGQMLNLSFGRCSVMLVLREVLEGCAQGGVVQMKPRFLSGAMRGTFRKQDGQLYVVGSTGWQTSAVRDGSFQRVRYTGKNINLPVQLKVQQNGIQLTFSDLLEKETAEDPGSYGIEQWNYRYTKEYGSKEYSVSSPEEVGHDPVDVKSVKLLADGRTVFLEIPNLQPVMQMQIQYNVNNADGKTVRGEIFNTINRLGPEKN
ncbi:MAG: DUF6797 domain-containing protein [Verrucomicrobiota bacterium]